MTKESSFIVTIPMMAVLLVEPLALAGYGLFLESFFLFRWGLKLAKSVMTVKLHPDLQ